MKKDTILDDSPLLIMNHDKGDVMMKPPGKEVVEKGGK